MLNRPAYSLINSTYHTSINAHAINLFQFVHFCVKIIKAFNKQEHHKNITQMIVKLKYHTNDDTILNKHFDLNLEINTASLI